MSDEQPGTSEAQAHIDIKEIVARIPHRYPFLLIDRAEDYQPNKSLVGVKCVTINEPFFEGHFPGYPVMPGVLIIEAMAQTGALLMSKTQNMETEGKTIYFLSVDNCRFRSPVRPGQVLKLHVQVIRERGKLFKFKGEAFVDGKLCAEAEFAAMLADIQ